MNSSRIPKMNQPQTPKFLTNPGSFSTTTSPMKYTSQPPNYPQMNFSGLPNYPSNLPLNPQQLYSSPYLPSSVPNMPSSMQSVPTSVPNFPPYGVPPNIPPNYYSSGSVPQLPPNFQQSQQQYLSNFPHHPSMVGQGNMPGQPMRPPNIMHRPPVGAPEAPQIEYPRVGRKIVRDEKDKLDTEIRNVACHSELFSRLVCLEKEIDQRIKMRKLLCLDAVTNTAPVHKKIRLLISNTHDNQDSIYCTSEQDRLKLLNEQPSWTLRIEGKLPGQQKTPTTPKLSFFIKRIFIQLNKDEYPDDWMIEWSNGTTLSEVDGFEVKRMGNKETTAHIYLDINYQPPRYKINDELAKIIGNESKCETKASIITKLWNYIKNNKLQDENDPLNVILNVPLKNVFTVDTIKSLEIPDLLMEHLSPPDPEQIFYTIITQGKPKEQIYELEIDFASPLQFFEETEKENIEALDKKILPLLKQFEMHKSKRKAFSDLCSEPVVYFEKFVANFIKEFQTNHDKSSDKDTERTTSVYYHPAVESALINYIDTTKAK